MRLSMSLILVMVSAGGAYGQGQKLYVLARSDIIRTDLDGTNLETVLTSEGVVDALGIVSATLVEFAIDSVGAKVYFVSAVTINDGQGNIGATWMLRSNLDGTGIELLYDLGLGLQNPTIYRPPPRSVPNATQWGFVVMVTLMLAGATAILGKRRSIAT